MAIDGFSAILLISDDAPALARFYRDVLEVPLRDEVHDGIAPHYGCDLGGTHFAIHPAGEWPGTASREPRSPVLAFRCADVDAFGARLAERGVTALGPFDHGFGHVLTLRDPEGHHVEIVQLR